MKLRPFQFIGVEALVRKTRYLIRDDPGLGKTIQLISAVNVLQETSDKIIHALVICPKGMIITWEIEIRKWNRNSSYVVINHDRLLTKDFATLAKSWDILIADESHLYLKNIATKTAKAFFVLADMSKVVWLSTATVASKSAEDYYATLKILLPDFFKGWSLDRFKKTFCETVTKTVYSKKPLRYGTSHKLRDNHYATEVRSYEGFKNTDQLNEIFSKCSIGRKQEEVAPELPPLTITDHFIEGTPATLRAANDKELTEIADFIRLGMPPTPHHQEILKDLGMAKIPAVIELLQSYPADVKVVVFGWHRDVIAALVKAIKEQTDRTCDFITGEVNSADERQNKIDRFQNGDLDILVLNMQSGGVGITLTAATKGIYVQFPYTAIHWIQSQKRIHRIGSTKPVQIIKVMIDKSKDAEIFSILEDRMSGIEQVGV